MNGSVLRHGFTYTALGLPYQSTSFSDTAGATIVNRVQDVYNGLGQLTGEYQSHTGDVVTTGPSPTPEVQYAYAGPSSSQNYSRLTSMTYPNGRILHDGYNSGIDDAISRVSFLADDNGSGGIGSHLADYSYLGASTIVNQAFGNGVSLTYIKQTGDSSAITSGPQYGGDQYTGLDRFGQVIDQNYVNTSTPTPTTTDRFQYGYDGDGNVLYKNNLLSSTNSALYHANSTTTGDNNTAYDPLGRLTAFTRGTLSASGNNGSTLDTVANASVNTAANSAETWSLDALGNWSSSASGAGTGTSTAPTLTSTARTYNSRNELTSVGSSSLAYDYDGNTTTDQSGYTYTYDAWNHAASATAAGGLVETYHNNALGQRISDSYCTTGYARDGSDNLYYSQQGQVLEDANQETDQSTVGNLYSCTCTANTDTNTWAESYVNDLVLRDRSQSQYVYTQNLSTRATTSNTTSGTTRLYAQHDANYDVTALTDTSGNVQERFVYDPYGQAAVLASAWTAGTDSAGWRTGFQGLPLDPMTGLYGGESGDYSPILGGQLQPDAMMTYRNGHFDDAALVGYSATQSGAHTKAGVTTVQVGQTDGDVLIEVFVTVPHAPRRRVGSGYTLDAKATGQGGGKFTVAAEDGGAIKDGFGSVLILGQNPTAPNQMGQFTVDVIGPLGPMHNLVLGGVVITP